MQKKRIAIIGAGAMGLACAYDLLKHGYHVDVYEKEDRLGGMSASFDFDGINIERYYHFVCGPDYPLFDLMKEIGILDKLTWNETKMGFYYEGKLYKWGNPLFLLTFPGASIISKLRYGLHLFLSSKRSEWKTLDKISAITWIKGAVGEEAYRVFWKPLFDLKFYEYANNISAAWIWTRIKRVALSRKNLFVERMGFIDGGSDTLFKALEDKIKLMNGQIFLNSAVQEVLISNGRPAGVIVNQSRVAYDSVITTIPLPYIPDIIPELPQALKEKYHSVKNIGVVCVILKMSTSLTNNFWLNINDPHIGVPGMIEYSNLNPMKEKILYVPFYLDKDNPKYNYEDTWFINEVVKYILQINPGFSEQEILATRVHRSEYAQPVCSPGYLDIIPPVGTDVAGLYIADTSYYYPEDRSISESIRLGQEIASKIRATC